MLQKAPRLTRERILELSLRLFNEFGEPNITTTVIADEMHISPGNLYYHFSNKEDIVNSIFIQFEVEVERILTVPGGRRSNIEDVWLYLHGMFELIWRYRFFYRDLNDLLSRNRKLELHFKLILAHKIKVAKQLCEDLCSEQSMQASDMEIDAMATNMVVVATYWLSYEYVRNPRKYCEPQSMSDALARGCYQVLALIGPYLRKETHLLFQKLSEEYWRKFRSTLSLRGRSVPQAKTRHINVRQVQAQVEFVLVIGRLHVAAQLVKGLVVLLFLDVRQFMHGNHAQKFQRRLFEQRADADFMLGLQLASLHPGNGGVQTQSMVDHVNFVVESHFVDRVGIAQECAFQVLHILIQRLVGADAVRYRIALAQ